MLTHSKNGRWTSQESRDVYVSIQFVQTLLSDAKWMPIILFSINYFYCTLFVRIMQAANFRRGKQMEMQTSSQTWSKTRFSSQPTRKQENANQPRSLLMDTWQGTQLEGSYCLRNTSIASIRMRHSWTHFWSYKKELNLKRPKGKNISVRWKKWWRQERPIEKHLGKSLCQCCKQHKDKHHYNR